MKIKTVRRTRYYLEDEDGVEYEVPYAMEDFDNTFVKEGDKVIIGYLLHDSDCSNPMEDDVQGTLYTYRGGVITDDDSAPQYLALENFDSPPDRDLELDEVVDEACRRLRALLLTGDFLLHYGTMIHETDNTPLEVYRQVLNWLTSDPPDNDWIVPYQRFDWEESDEVFLKSLPGWEQILVESWDYLYGKGTIGAYLAVPVQYYASVHGPGTTSIGVTGMDSANAVWVPSVDCVDSIKAQSHPEGVSIEWRGACGSVEHPLHAVVLDHGRVVFDAPHWHESQLYIEKTYGEPPIAELRKYASEYADSVLSEYQDWCNGDCYGVVVLTYNVSDGVSELLEEEAVWGFIGMDYAERELQEAIKSKLNG